MSDRVTAAMVQVKAWRYVENVNVSTYATIYRSLGGLAVALLLTGICAQAGWDPEVGAPYQRLIEQVAQRHKVDLALFSALVEAESARNAGAVSRVGALGLAQLMPATAKRFSVEDPTNPEDNLEGAARYLKWLLARYEGNVELALAAYNAGEGAVDRFAGVPPYPETRAFVRKVMGNAGLLSDSAGDTLRARPPSPARLVERESGRMVLTNR